MPPAPKASITKNRLKTASDPSSTKTLTPQRKHRKLLKDGTSEVWPESIEKIFVQGLRQYWRSPWATYSRGRSRWRNQFLVDYLQKAGIDRTKKQVASHIQVLRNMWKGEPEFHLVAGGEELFLETGLLAPPKLECDTSALIPLHFDEQDQISPLSSGTSGFSPLAEFIFERPTVASLHSPTSALSPDRLSNDSPTGRCSSSPSPDVYGDGQGQKRLAFATESRAQGTDHLPRASPLAGSSAASSPSANAVDVDLCVAVQPSPSCSPAAPTRSNNPSHKDFVRNRLRFVALWADGMLPFTVPSDDYSLSSPEPVVFRIGIRMPSIDDIRCPPTLHGFHGTISLAAPWQFSAQCITKVFSDGSCIAEDFGALQLVSSHCSSLDDAHMVQAFLPESSLSRSRWFDASMQTTILQQIVVDNVNLAYIVYELDRKDVGVLPSAHILGIQKYRYEDGIPPSIAPVPQPHFMTIYSEGSHEPFIPRLVCRAEPSLSCALIPNLSSFNSPMLF